ncbi:MAG: CobB/CobQ domain protein glutamine amidotransferase [Candidatus Saccharibacteria bacterium GW2011_GWC2_48_9]|nr:MAG: CobB/CobQ domain protein glutamine amidotransferase [Candidatus Saccharibacteria bacterium GW2011_GWC2_48_9]HCH34943.1 glutamine amidotransferase [Candidatus Saccharibacteria bacterium]
MTKRQLTIVQLYPDDMNIYGDWGNVLTVKKRAEWHGFEVELIDYNVGDIFPESADILIGGGGQDSGQLKVQADLQKLAPTLQALADDDTPMLMICGLYQLFGRFFKTSKGQIIDGIGIFHAETHAGPERLIGNIVTHNEQFGDIIGYENHSGQTYIDSNMQPLGTIVRGAGNNGQDETEGCIYRNVIGTYLHGSLLPKNPAIADALIEEAAKKKFGDFTPTVIEDRFASKARDVALKRPR